MSTEPSKFLSLVAGLILALLPIASAQNHSLCVANAKFTLLEEPVVFEVAKQACESRGETLARVTNLDEYNAMDNLTLEVTEGLVSVWIGRPLTILSKPQNDL